MNWKPTTCADCPAEHPSHSHDGRDGPWRCKACHAKASPRSTRERIGVPPPDAAGQGNLL